MGVYYVPTSVTPDGNRNPGFRIYEIDPDTGDVVDYVQYKFDLKAQGQRGDGKCLLFLAAIAAACFALAADDNDLYFRGLRSDQQSQRLGTRELRDCLPGNHPVQPDVFFACRVAGLGAAHGGLWW